MKSIATFILLLFCTCNLTLAQERPKWQFGVSAELGRDYYDRNYDPEYSRIQNLLKNFPSKYSLGAGSWAERKIDRRWAALMQLNYAWKEMLPEFFGERSRTFGSYSRKETHHRAFAEIGARWYINPDFPLQFFVDGKVGANVFIASCIYNIPHGKIVTWDAFCYGRVSPVGSAAVGVKWKRFALMAEYDRDLVRVKRTLPNSRMLSQSIVAKTTFTIFKSH
ncbi:hypothetical protein [Dyadobacter sp. MSC1_007]|jgi:hypothetical protein|uniref:hypothetical protein n=1 Tax=Dyadobacter sp. MSC1_007 TaxID=2909264 RepID=UPI0020307A90|nr:hypothetical protein [Dyadobacter sp. MSC1_007]